MEAYTHDFVKQFPHWHLPAEKLWDCDPLANGSSVESPQKVTKSRLLFRLSEVPTASHFTLFQLLAEIQMNTLKRSPESRIEVTQMNDMMLKMYATLQSLTQRQEGQDVVEYSLTFAMVAFGCVASMSALATGIESVFSQVGTTLTASIT
jgi:Flp pilus assembly pilin Flp